MPDVQIDVEGLKQFRRDLAEIDKGFVKELGQEYKQIGQMIQSGAAARASSLGGVAAKAADAVKATARTSDVSIKLSAGTRTPFAFGAEFGGGAKPTTRQFQPWKGNGADAGDFLYPTIAEKSQQIVTEFEQVVGRVTARAFPN